MILDVRNVIEMQPPVDRIAEDIPASKYSLRERGVLRIAIAIRPSR